MPVWIAQSDATYNHTIDSWDSPFSPLESDVASFGMRVDAVEPHVSYAWSGSTSFLTDFKAAAATSLLSTFTDVTKVSQLIVDGRTPNALDFWSAGAPLWYGSSQRGRVAIHYGGALRPVVGRSWFATASAVTLSLALAGSGLVRCTKTISGTTTDLLVDGVVGQTLTEAYWLDQGYRFTDVVTLNPGDRIDIYYVQNFDIWGGLVAKVLSGSVQTNDLAAAAPVMGCGLFDTGTQPVKCTWKHTESINVHVEKAQAPQATLSVPLVNPTIHDGFGWEWRKDSDVDPGYLVNWDGGVQQFSLRRGRLVRIKIGYRGQEEAVFTGIIQDIASPRDGSVQIKCIGFEYRALESRNKLEPDQISYMTFGYRNTTGLFEPVFNIPAYDAWTIEDAVADSLLRSGIESSRLRQPKTVQKADGSYVPVVFQSDAFNKFRARSKNVLPDYIQFRSTCSGAANAFDYRQIGTTVSYTVQAGDYFEYDVWQDPKNPEFKAGVDFATGSGDKFRAHTILDQNGLAGHSHTDTAAFTDGQWYKRKFDIGTTFAGSAITSWAVVFEGDVAGNYEAHFANIRVVNAAGATVFTFYAAGNVTAVPWITGVSSTPLAYTGGAVVGVLQTGAPLRIERAAHYGNVGNQFTEDVPVDDPYLFTPEAKDDAWSRVLEIADRYGYDIRFDAVGDAVLSTRYNASFAYDFDAFDSVQASTRKITASAYRGAYIEFAVATTITKAVTGARIDISLPRGPSLSPWATITVQRASDMSTVATLSSVAVTAPSDIFFYDNITDVTGNNATLLTLYSGDFDKYIITLVGTGAGTRRVDALFVYHTDPTAPKFALSTLRNALTVTPQDTGDDMRNIVTVVGARIATTTDSVKFKTNPNNPDPEFVVQAAVDAASISDPTAPNYIGMRRESTIIDEKIADQDYASYLARTFVYRYRTPRPPADILHTLIAVIDLRMPITGEEAMFKSVTPQSTLWVTGFTHDVNTDATYTTTISTSAWPEFPSYEPRDDIDIDVDFAGVPVANVAVQYVSCSGPSFINTNLPGSGVVHESVSAGTTSDANASADVDLWASAATVHPAAGGQPEYLDLAGAPWPPVLGTVQISPAVGGTTHVTEVYAFGDPVLLATPAPLSSPQSTAPGFGVVVGPNVFVVKLKGVARLPITNVWAQYWIRTGANFTRVTTQALSVGNPGYTYDPVENALTVRLNHTAPLFSQTSVAFAVEYDQYASRLGDRWLANSPYHHLMNVDYRDSNRKIYLPWDQGDGGSSYLRPTAVTAYDVKYRKLGNVDPTTKAYVAAYGSGSPFFDVTSSELGYLVSLTFDALISGYYRISVRSVFDDTVVAYLTETTADPQVPESHWQFVSAGLARSFNWDGVDQVGSWNQRQSDSYAALSQGWFETDTKEPIGAGFYVWNREITGGKYAPLALISDERDASGVPAYGQGTYAAWYFQIECKNEVLAARFEDSGLPYPRVVRTIEPKPLETPPTYSTGGARAAVVYTHMPVPAQLELEVASWSAAVAYDPTDPAHLGDSFWSAPWYDIDIGSPTTFEGFINNQAPSRLRFRVTPRAGALWSTLGGEAQIKLTRHVHLKTQVFDQFVVGEGTNWPTPTPAHDSGVEQRTVYNRSFHNDDHTITFVDDGYRAAKTLKNSTNLTATGTTEWIFRPLDFKKDFGRGITNESINFMDYLQLEEVPKWEQQRSAASEHSRMMLSFMAYLFYLSAYCIDRSGRRSWGVNRTFVDQFKITDNTYAKWWNPVSPTVAADHTSFKAELPYDPTNQQRRTIVCRQWDGEGTWQADQRARWSFDVGSIGDKLLRHKWQDHEPAATNLNGSAWPTLDTDFHSKWSRDHGRVTLPAAFANLTRQLGASITLTTRLNAWTWERDPAWIPCVTRDFHPYYRLPPMVAPISEESLKTSYIYGIVDISPFDSINNVGRDSAKSQTWNSWARDMNEAYDSGDAGKVHFSPGTITDPTASEGVGPNSIDYERQDDCAHYEDLRGIFSRGPRAAEQPRKVVPSKPYFINMYGYNATNAVPVHAANPLAPLPLFSATVSAYFRLAFRTEYVWESSTFFPIDLQNRENLEQMNVWRARFSGDGTLTAPLQTSYDAGAWTGWKDDLGGASLYQTNAFDTGYMPFTVGPTRGPTADIYMHLVLVNERRSVPL